MNNEKPRNDACWTVSVIVPTVGRLELARALQSVRGQETEARLEIIVVNDGAPGIDIPADVCRLADRVVRTSGRTGGSNARNMGMDAATGDFIAFIDDDDEWLPRKLELQLALALAAPDPRLVLVAGRHVHVDARTGLVSGSAPDRLIGTDETVEHYLFRRRPPSGSRPSMYTSTLLCERTLALSERWDTGLRRHQDWDWVIRLGRRPGVRVLQTTEPVVRIQTGTPQSISASSDWQGSLHWAEKALREDSAICADFLTAQTLRYALQARDLRGVRATLRAIARTKRVPSAGPIVIGCAGILPRRTIERIMSTTAARG